jgi:hypothetical protein
MIVGFGCKVRDNAGKLLINITINDLTAATYLNAAVMATV